MKPTFTNLQIARLAYNEAPQIERNKNSEILSSEYKMLKGMQKIVDQCITEPSQKSIDNILAALNAI